jgi:hypothetical protein
VPPDDKLVLGSAEPDAAALAAAGASLRATCKRMEETSKLHSMAPFGSGPGPFGAEDKRAIWTSKTMGCWPGPKGAWILDVGVFHKAADVGVKTTWQLVYLTPDARRVTGPQARGEQQDADGEGRTITSVWGAHDFDGDGIPEVGVSTFSYWSIDGVGRTTTQLFHVQGGAVVPWDPVPGEKVEGSVDADHDGRVDLVIDGHGPWNELGHALAGGGFSLDDEVTRAFLHSECGRPLPPIPSNPLMPVPAPVAGALPPDAARQAAADKQCAAVLALDSCPRAAP